MSQHYLLSAASRPMSVGAIARMTEEEAREFFVRCRWPEGVKCPSCQAPEPYSYKSRRLWKCRACFKQFTVTSGTAFSGVKAACRDVLLACATFVNAQKGISAIQLSRDIGWSYKPAYILCHKLREAVSIAQRQTKLSGTVEVDGAFFGGHIRWEQKRQTGWHKRMGRGHWHHRMVVIVLRERGGTGRTLTFACKRESAALFWINAHVERGSTLVMDQAHAWDRLARFYPTLRINHKYSYSDGEGACTNQAESFFSMLRRMNMAVHHHIAGDNLQAYAAEMAWRQDSRRRSNLQQLEAIVGLALLSPKSEKWSGYWQRRRENDSVQRVAISAAMATEHAADRAAAA